MFTIFMKGSLKNADFNLFKAIISTNRNVTSNVLSLRQRRKTKNSKKTNSSATMDNVLESIKVAVPRRDVGRN